MSIAERVAARAKKLADKTKKAADRFALVPQSIQDAPAGEVAELFSSQWRIILSVYKEYVTVYDQEFEAGKGRQLAVNETTTLKNVLRLLCTLSAPSMPISNRDEFLKFVEHEVHCFLHAENHLAVRRHGLELLLLWHEMDRNAALPASHVDANFASLVVSSLDWEYFKTGCSGVVLPTTVVELRKARHKAFPPRARVTIGFDEERERAALEMLRLIFDQGLRSDKLHWVAFWWTFFVLYLGPIFYPQEFFEARITPRQLLEGFSQGVPPKIHAVVISYLVRLAALRAENAVSRQGEDSFWTQESEVRIVALLLAVSPTITAANVADTTSTCIALNLLHDWFEGRSLPLATAVASDVLEVALKDDHIPMYATLLSQATDEGLAASLQMLTELVLRLLVHVISSTQYTGDLVDTAIMQLGIIVERLSYDSKTKLVGQTFALACRALWQSVMIHAAPLTPRFAKFLLPVSYRLQQRSRGSIGSTDPYFFHCWASVLLHSAKQLARETSKFCWPAVDLHVSDEATSKTISETRTDMSKMMDQGSPFEAESTSADARFDAFNALLHETMTQLAQDGLAAREIKCTAVCESVQIITKSSNQVDCEPANLVRLVAPYLLAAATVQVEGRIHGPVEALALETMALTLNLTSPSDSPLDPVLGAGLLNVVAGALTDTGKVGNADVTRRILIALFPSHDGSPTFFEHGHYGARCYEDTIFNACDRLIDTPVGNSVIAEQGQVAALIGKTWQLHFKRFASNASVTTDGADFLVQMRKLLRGNPPVRSVGVAVRIAQLVSSWCLEALETSSAWDLLIDAIGVITTQLNVVDLRVIAAVKGVLMAIVDQARMTLRDPKRCSPQQQLDRRQQLSRAILFPCAGAALFHLSNWNSTRTKPGAMTELLNALSDFAVVCGHLEAPVDPAGTVLAQVVCDVVAFARNGQSYLRYSIPTPTTGYPIIVKILGTSLSELSGDEAARHTTGGVLIPTAGDQSRAWPVDEHQRDNEVKSVIAAAERLGTDLSNNSGLCDELRWDPLTVELNKSAVCSWGINQAVVATAYETVEVSRCLNIATEACNGTCSWQTEEVMSMNGVKSVLRSAAETDVAGSMDLCAPICNNNLTDLMSVGWQKPTLPAADPSVLAFAALDAGQRPFGFLPDAVLPKCCTGSKSLCGSLLLHMGLLLGDGSYRTRPASSAIKPQRFSVPLTAGVVHGTRPFVVVSLSHGARDFAEATKAELQIRSLARALGGESESADGMLCMSSSIEDVHVVTSPLNSTVLASTIGHEPRLHVIWAASLSLLIAMVRSVTPNTVTSPGEVPLVVVGLTPCPGGGSSRVVHLFRRGSVMVSPLGNGIPVTLSTLPSVLRAAALGCLSRRHEIVSSQADRIRVCTSAAPESETFEAVISRFVS